MANSGLTLDVLGSTIVAKINKADDFVVSAAIDLKEAHERIQAGEGETTWKEWVVTHVMTKTKKTLSDRRVQELLQIGYSPDPQVKADEMRANTAARTEAYRERQIVSEPEEARHVTRTVPEQNERLSPWREDFQLHWNRGSAADQAWARKIVGV